MDLDKGTGYVRSRLLHKRNVIFLLLRDTCFMPIQLARDWRRNNIAWMLDIELIQWIRHFIPVESYWHIGYPLIRIDKEIRLEWRTGMNRLDSQQLFHQQARTDLVLGRTWNNVTMIGGIPASLAWPSCCSSVQNAWLHPFGMKFHNSSRRLSFVKKVQSQ